MRDWEEFLDGLGLWFIIGLFIFVLYIVLGP